MTRRGKRIQYHYDGLNRLIKIEYPFSPATEYTYGEYSGTARGDLAAGRVTKLSDESGTIEYRYGLLGQVEEERRTIKLLPLSGGRSKIATMKYTSDYLGRMEKIEYPDGEVVEYGYDYGGQITRVTGTRNGTEFPYVKETGYDEYGQRIYIEYGSGVKSRYEYDPFRRWLSRIVTESPVMGNKYQEIAYEFDDVGNVLGYENTSFGHTTSQRYEYDGLYQLTEARGRSRSHPNGLGGHTEYNTDYRQQFMFNAIGNMTGKVSTENVSNTNRIGMNLNYNLDYEYYAGTHKAERIGNRYYDYDLNGNLVAEKEGSHAVVQPDGYMPYGRDGDLYYTDYGFGLVKPGNHNKEDDGTYQRDYKWNERNLLSESRDSAYTVQYRYGADGQRALKYVTNSGRATVYFNKMWQTSNGQAEWLQGKHVYVGEDRLATKYNSEGNENTQAEQTRVYYYHSDHLGSAQVVTNHRGQLHERLEYTPYGELWIDWRSDDAPEDGTPYRFTGKELDAETGLYYYGARYLDPKTSRWLSGDPALGEYTAGSPAGNGGIYNHVNMNGYHYGGNNPIRYSDPDGRSDFETMPYNPFKHHTELKTMEFNAMRDKTELAYLNNNQRIEIPLFKKSFTDEQVKDFIGKIWALPMTIFGVVAGSTMLLISRITGNGGYAKFENNALTFTTNIRFFIWTGSITFGNTIIHAWGKDKKRSGDNVPSYDGNYNVNLGRHEEAHTYQYQKYGIFTILLIIGSAIKNGGIQAGIKNKGLWAFMGQSDYEKEADRYGGMYAQ